jgi:hypothetical protein
MNKAIPTKMQNIPNGTSKNQLLLPVAEPLSVGAMMVGDGVRSNPEVMGFGSIDTSPGVGVGKPLFTFVPDETLVGV